MTWISIVVPGVKELSSTSRSVGVIQVTVFGIDADNFVTHPIMNVEVGVGQAVSMNVLLEGTKEKRSRNYEYPLKISEKAENHSSHVPDASSEAEKE